MGLSESIDRRLRALGLQKPIQLGFVTSIKQPQVNPEGITATRVMVSDIADQPIPCDWSGAFEAEMAAVRDVQDLVGKRVEVHFVDGQPIVAHTVIVGDK